VVEGRLDDGRPERLLPGTHLRYHEDLQPAHHWGWTIRGRLLTPGRHILRVHVREPDAPLHQFEHAVMV
jgi:hypothetical protein